MKVSTVVVTGTILVAAAVAAAAFAVPMPASWTESRTLFYVPLTLTFAFATLQLGAVVLFLLSLDVYKTGLRRAFMLMCAGVVLLAFGAVQLPIVSGFNFWQSTWVTHGGLAMAFVLGGIASYVGVRSLARLVGLKHWLTRFGLVLPVIAVLCFGTAFLPHVTVSTTELAYDISTAILAWGSLFLLATGAALLKLHRHMGEHYQAANARLAAAFLATALALGLAFFSGLISNKSQDNWSILIDVVSLAGGALFLTAGYSFIKTKEY